MASSKESTTDSPAKEVIYIKTDRTRLDDICIEVSSGWRDLNEKCVKDFEEIILKGDYGKTTLAKASLLCDANKEVLGIASARGCGWTGFG